MSPTGPSALPALLPLEGVVRHYDWGSRTFLAGLRSRAGDATAPGTEPEAELWFGAHPSAPSVVALPDGPRRLDELVASHRSEILGTTAGDGAELPFLLKILAAERPLSLQLHPDSARARRGHAREEEDRVPRGARHRLYPDPHPKPEIACALTPFSALQGLRPPAEARALLAALALPETDALLERAPASRAQGLLEEVLALDPSSASALFDAVAEAARTPDNAEVAWAGRLAESYPGDPLILAPLLLRRVELTPGEALFTAPGVLHSYLDGAAVELMGSSDNVLRAGLTSKHVARDQLLAALDPSLAETRILTASAPDASRWRRYDGTSSLQLSFADVEPGEPLWLEPAPGPRVLLALSGELVVESGGGAPLRLRAAEAALVRPETPRCRLEGRGRVYCAGAIAD